MHDDGPDIDTNIESNDGVKTDLSASTLANALHIENKSKAEAADTGRLMLIQMIGQYKKHLGRDKEDLHAKERRDER